MSDSNPSTPERFPDLYALLGLEPLERDVVSIEQTLRRLAGQIQASANTTDDAHRQRLQRARKLFELGKQQLLDPQRKQRYDQQWQALYGHAAAQPNAAQASAPTVQAVAKKQPTAVGNPPVQTTARSTSWDLRELRTLLPSGDPYAPFREAEFAASGAADLKSRYADDFANLQSLLAPNAVATADVDSRVVNTGVTNNGVDEEESPNAAIIPSQSSDIRSAQMPTTKRSATGRPPVISIAGRLRKKQERSLLWGAIGALAAVGIVLGIAYWLMQPTPDSTLAANTAGAPNATLDPENSLLPTADPAPDRSRPRRSGLPSVPGIDSSSILPGMLAVSDTSSSEVAMNTEDASPAGSDTTATMEPAGNGTLPETVALSASERERWTSAMLEVRKTIGQQQYAEAAQQLDNARSLAKTPQQTEQLASLVTIEQLAHEFSDALQRALAGMGAAETFMIGKSTPASFVGAADGRLTLQIDGQSQSWSMTELPIGIAFAIVDMTMDREHPRSLAAKAAFTLVHPAAQGNDMAAKRAMQMMSTAIDAGAVSEDMAQVFHDDYTLP